MRINHTQEKVGREASMPPGSPPSAGGIARTFSSFRHRNYQLWFGGQLISVVGTWMQIIAQGWLVYQLSHSEFALGLVGFASAIPVLLVSPWGGVLTDVLPKRTLLVITQATAMMLAFVLAALTFTGLVQVWHILVLASILGLVNAFDAPARQAIVVEMVGRDDLGNAIALNSMMFNGARVVGPALGGLLLALVGSAWCFLLNGISYVAVIASLLMMSMTEARAPRRIEHPIAQFMEGVRYARGHRGIFGILSLSVVFSVFGIAYANLLPAFVDKVLHADATVYGLINTAVGVGAMVAALLMAYYGGAARRGKVLVVSNMVYPLLLAAFAFNTRLPVALVLAFGLGLGFMLQGNSMNSLLQLHVEDRMRGRVMSLYTLAFFGLSPLGALAAGAIAEKLPMSVAISLTGAGMLVLSLLVLLKFPEISQME